MAEEVPTRIEPAFFEESIPSSISDLVVEMQAAAAKLGHGLHNDAAFELSDLVRVMNCYYSNLIEGHNTRPKDIERALAGAEIEEATRPLVLEAKAHVVVQREIDRLSLDGALPSPTSSEFIAWVHRRFYEEMPEEFRFVEGRDGPKVEIVPGAFRSKSEDDVSVGRHRSPSSPYVKAFMDHFSKRYAAAQAGATNKIIAIAAAHHRLNFIHPFMDGNGRVSRLMSHAMAQEAGVGGKGLWSISRGLARGLKDKTEYKSMMDHADQQRMNDRDGRGNLSAKALQDYCEWFLSVALDQIQFSNAVFSFDKLESRYRKLIEDVIDDKRAPDIISAALKHGSIDRGDIGFITKSPDRTARNTLKALLDHGFLKSASPKTPVRIAFPLDYRERLFPNLFTDGEIDAPKPSVPSFITRVRTKEVASRSSFKPPFNEDEEFQKRVGGITDLQKSLGARSTLGKIAAQELATTEPTTVDWQSVEDRVIAESIGEHGQSRAEVIEALCEFSPGAVSQEQKDEIEKRVLAAAPALAAKYNKLIMDRKPKR
ncbi:Fic family protein [Rhizobium leguminosarum]|uniref:Fic family protein n=1 Tax=Rhizobium leguminosarum TaxID=384 RepID=UPI00143F9513|nr:Fic family protein [Rhizobium leguminosarum]NKL23823.1 Fic family protein [Rhizobium leguminosarum bv. viciae]